jgi:hypothetical protein
MRERGETARSKWRGTMRDRRKITPNWITGRSTVRQVIRDVVLIHLGVISQGVGDRCDDCTKNGGTPEEESRKIAW